MLMGLVIWAAVTGAPPLTAPATSALSAESLALGEQLARAGTLAALLPLLTAKETAELVADHPDLTPAEQAGLRRVAAATAQAGTARLMAALGRAYAARLSTGQMRAIIAFNATDAAKAQRAATPDAIAETMQALGSIDFKGEAMATFCAATGKGCPKDQTR